MAVSTTTRSACVDTSAPLEVYLLGRVDYASAVFLQERLVYDISGRRDRLGALLLCEHPPLITVGREGSRADILADERELAARQLEIQWSNRGGGCCVHVPGQLAVYPIIPLDRLSLGLAEYRRLLEEAVVAACGEMRVPAWREPTQPGVWSRCGQLAQLGITVRSQVAFHGLFVNVCPPLDWLRLIRPGVLGKPVASLASVRQRPIAMHTVRESLIRHLAAHLGYERHHLYTGHPLLRRTRKRVHVNT